MYPAGYGSLSDAQFARPLPETSMARPLYFFGRPIAQWFASATPYQKPEHGTDLSGVYPPDYGGRRFQGM